MLYAFGSIFIFCEHGELVNNGFNEFNEELCQCDWYLFSIEMQRNLIIFNEYTQQPAIIRGFANTVCTREAFKKVKKVSFSISIVIRILIWWNRQCIKMVDFIIFLL